MKKVLLFGTVLLGTVLTGCARRRILRVGAIWSASASALRDGGSRAGSGLCVDRWLLGPPRRTTGSG